MKGQLTSTTHTSSSDRVLYCRTTDHCVRGQFSTSTHFSTSTWKHQHGKRSALMDGSISSLLYSLEALLIQMCSTVTFNLAFSVFKTSKISILRAQWYYNATVSTLLFNTSFCNLLKHFLFFCCKLSLYYSL